MVQPVLTLRIFDPSTFSVSSNHEALTYQDPDSGNESRSDIFEAYGYLQISESYLDAGKCSLLGKLDGVGHDGCIRGFEGIVETL